MGSSTPENEAARPQNEDGFFRMPKQSIAIKMFRVVFPFYFSLACLVTFIHVVLEYQHTKANVYAELSRVGTIFKPAVADALWDMDVDRLEDIVNGISELPMVVGLVLRDKDGGIISIKGDTGPENGSLFFYRFNINHDGPSGMELLSEVTLVSNRAVVFDRLEIGFIMIVVNSIIKAIALWFLLRWVLRRYLFQPFQKFLRKIDEIDLDTIGHTRLDLEIKRDNELDVLQKSFNAMLSKIEGQKRHILAVESSARLKLEEKVQERTERLQESERALHRAQKMEAIGMMAGGVAHDLNNILTGILGYPELLLLQLPKSSPLRASIRAIQTSGERAAHIVADLLTMARGVASQREPHDLNGLVTEFLDSPECQTPLSLRPGLSCASDLQASASLIVCSPVHINKTVMNLLINAIEAIDDQGAIVIATRNQTVTEEESQPHGLQAGDYIVLTVEDDGSGIDAKDLEHIFEPFYTKKVMGKSGTGLGLAIVWNTVHDHGGYVVVESSEKGTCFSLYFPLCDDKEKVAQEADKPEIMRGNNEQILVVDDEVQLRDLASQMLHVLGYKVDVVCSGEEAVEFIRQTPVDLVVLDMVMDPGMNGRKTYEEILKLSPGQKAIIASGFSESDEVKMTIALGAQGVICKPYSMDQLGAMVQDALAG